MKYIMIKEKTTHYERMIPVIFPEMLVHKDVYESILHMMYLTNDDDNEYELVSAGFYNIGDKCSGYSESLKIQSEPERDTMIIDTYNYTHGLMF